MYYLFKYKNMTPSQYYNMKYGEKTILKAFIAKEIEDAQKIARSDKIFPVFEMK